MTVPEVTGSVPLGDKIAQANWKHGDKPKLGDKGTPSIRYLI